MIKPFNRLLRHLTVLGLIRQYLTQLATVLVWLGAFVNDCLEMLARIGHHHFIGIAINHCFNQEQVRQVERHCQCQGEPGQARVNVINKRDETC